MTRLALTRVLGASSRRSSDRAGAPGNGRTGRADAGDRRGARYWVSVALALGLLALNASSALAFDPKPIPPGKQGVQAAFDPQFVTVGKAQGVRPAFDPQPIPPGRPHSTAQLDGLRAALLRLGIDSGRGSSRGRIGAPALIGRLSGVRPACRCGGGGGGGGGTPWSQQAELTDPNGSYGGAIGWSVALSGDATTALVGAPYQNNGAGAAYVFGHTGNSWTELARVTAPDGASGDYFGTSVALSANGTLLIGAFGKNNHTGAAYVFTSLPYLGYVQQAELTEPNGSSNDEFGNAVALSSDGSTALIGAPFAHYSYGPGAGAAYTFTHSGSTWSLQTTLSASNASNGSEFGYAVALNSTGTSALIGAPMAGVGGAAYVFAYNTAWTQQAELTASNGANSDGFGVSVALSSSPTVALIGAPNANGRAGAAYIFAPLVNWSQQTELLASDGASNSYFGNSVALTANGGTALIGAPNANGASTNTGAAYVFQGSWSSWTQAAKLTASDGAVGDQLGGAVALSNGGFALVGAPGHPFNIGAAYIF